MILDASLEHSTSASAILRLRFEDGMTQSQIAARVGISQMHVSRLLRRALERLRAHVGEIDDDTDAA